MISGKVKKNNVKQHSTSISKKTLDIQHNCKLTEFSNHQENINNIKDQIKYLEEKIKSYKEKQYQGLELSDIDIENMLYLRDQRDSLVKELDVLNEQDEVEYFVNTAPILFQYYDIVEKGSSDDIQSVAVGENSILKFFMSSEEQQEKPKERDETIDANKTSDRASLLEKYMWLTDDNYIKQIETEVKEKCIHCSASNRNILLNEGMIHCNNCDSIEYILIDHDRPSYKDPPKEISYFSYKRINHLNEWISQIQGKETTDIPEEVYDKILLEIKKQKITNMADLTYKKIKEILKKLDNNKYYEHIPHIINKLNGLPIPHFEPELEEKLRVMFKMIQPLFLKYAPSSRKNFLSYSYCLHKFIQLLGRDEYLPNLPLLKSRDKLHQQDQIWKKICDELSWQFIESL